MLNNMQPTFFKALLQILQIRDQKGSKLKKKTTKALTPKTNKTKRV